MIKLPNVNSGQDQCIGWEHWPDTHE